MRQETMSRYSRPLWAAAFTVLIPPAAFAGAILRLVPLTLPLVIAASAIAPALAQPSSLVGSYNGNQMEMAAGLELTGDGRFRSALSYGALDEAAAGTCVFN